MADTETIKALEGAVLNSKRYDIKVCPTDVYKLENALDFITRQQAEIERLQKNSTRNLEKWKILDNRTKERYAELYEEAKKVLKSEAVKEFAEKLKNKIKTECNPYGKPTFDYDTSISIMLYIDNLVKEMGDE